MLPERETDRGVNFEKVAMLVLDQSEHGCAIVSQIARGFGVRKIRACTRVEQTQEALAEGLFDLMIASAADGDEDGIELVRWLRRQEQNKNRFMPVLLMSGHTTPSMVARVRDCGANFFIAKPLTPEKLLQRIVWVSRDKRPFVEVGQYLGPDRRFRMETPVGPGRRAGDVQTVDDSEQETAK
jgi:DNA-binding response OmpR family regulator